MRLKLITIRFNPETGNFEDGEFEAFQEAHEILSCHHHFFNAGDVVYLGVLLSYIDKSVERKKQNVRRRKAEPQEQLDEKEKALFEKMRKVRNEKAAELGLPAYILGTNAEMIQVIRKRCRTVQTLKTVRGFGEKKIKSVGRDFLELTKAFYPETENEHAG